MLAPHLALEEAAKTSGIRVNGRELLPEDWGSREPRTTPQRRKKSASESRRRSRGPKRKQDRLIEELPVLSQAFFGKERGTHPSKNHSKIR